MHFTEQRILQEQQRCEDQRKAEESYENWKRQKDLEQRLMIANNTPAEPHQKRNTQFYMYATESLVFNSGT